MCLDAIWHEIVAVLLSETDEFLFIIPKTYDSLAIWVLHASLIKVTSQELCCDGAEHDNHEEEEDHDIEHDRQGVQDGRYQTGHVWNLIDRSEWSQNTNNFNR